MASNLRDPETAGSDRPNDNQQGLGADELRAEQANDLPDREAMSILDVGAIEVGLPIPDDLDGAIDGPVPIGTLPVDGLPVEQYPIDQLPIDRLPVETLPIDEVPVQPLPTDPPVVGEPIGVPNPAIVSQEPGRLA
jgi:hypothetical protein